MSSETTWTFTMADLDKASSGIEWHWVAREIRQRLENLTARRSQPAPEAVPRCPSWCGSGEVPPLGARVYVREAPRGTADPHGWYASEECRTSSRCVHPAGRSQPGAETVPVCQDGCGLTFFCTEACADRAKAKAGGGP